MTAGSAGETRANAAAVASGSAGVSAMSAHRRPKEGFSAPRNTNSRTVGICGRRSARNAWKSKSATSDSHTSTPAPDCPSMCVNSRSRYMTLSVTSTAPMRFMAR